MLPRSLWLLKETAGRLHWRSGNTQELEVLKLLVLGYTNAEIADRLCLAVRTVESHRARLQHKVHHMSRAELVRYAREHDIIP